MNAKRLVHPASSQTGAPIGDLWPLAVALRSTCRFVDLTHPFRPGIPRGLGFDDERRTVLFHHERGLGTKGDGFLAHEYSLPGQWGTHVDPPAHFVPGGRFIHEISVSEMLLPLVVLDLSSRAAADADFELSARDVLDWEERHGHIPEASFVVLRTDWSRRWPDADLMRNADVAGTAHFPGWGHDALRLLCEERDVIAFGHETTDTDPGRYASRGDFSREAYLLGRDRWQVELLTKLDKVPETGALAVAAFPNVHEGSGFPARVFAIVPSEGS